MINLRACYLVLPKLNTKLHITYVFTKVKVLRIEYGNRINRTNQMIVKELLKFVSLCRSLKAAERSLIKPFSFRGVKHLFDFFFQNQKTLLKNRSLPNRKVRCESEERQCTFKRQLTRTFL